LHEVWKHFTSDGVVARVWECDNPAGGYSTLSPKGLQRCAQAEQSRVSGAASVLRWDVPVRLFCSTRTLPTEDELAAATSKGLRAIGRFPTGESSPKSSRPFSSACGSLFWDVRADDRGVSFAHDAWHVSNKSKPRTKDCGEQSPAEYVASRLKGGSPWKWHQCHHSDWDAMLQDQMAWTMHTLILSHGSTCDSEVYNQVHLSWNGTTRSESARTQIRALFYVNESAGRYSMSRNQSGAWHAAALDAAARAYHKVRVVVSDPDSPYFQLPVVQIRPDGCGDALKAAMMHRFRVHSRNTSLAAAALVAHKLTDTFRATEHAPPPDGLARRHGHYWPAYPLQCDRLRWMVCGRRKTMGSGEWLLLACARPDCGRYKRRGPLNFQHI